MPSKYLVVLDTVIIVQSAINPKGVARKCLSYFERGEISIAVSRDTIEEVKDVLSRAYIRDRYEHITDDIVVGLVQLLTYKGRFVRNVRERFTYPRDPKDEPYLNLAIEVQADYLVSWDNDLLDLMRWDKAEGRDSQKRFRFLKIVNPKEFLQVVGQAGP